MQNFALNLRDKQVIASALGQLRIIYCNFVKTMKILVKLILNCPRALAITSTYRTVISHVINFQCEKDTLEVCIEFLQNAPSNSVLSSSPFIFAAVSTFEIICVTDPLLQNVTKVVCLR